MPPSIWDYWEFAVGSATILAAFFAWRSLRKGQVGRKQVMKDSTDSTQTSQTDGTSQKMTNAKRGRQDA